jgi:hypothetical protein
VTKGGAAISVRPKLTRRYPATSPVWQNLGRQIQTATAKSRCGRAECHDVSNGCRLRDAARQRGREAKRCEKSLPTGECVHAASFIGIGMARPLRECRGVRPLSRRSGRGGLARPSKFTYRSRAVRRVRTNLVLRQLVCCVGGKLKWLCGWFCRAGSRWREKFNQIKETRRTTAPPIGDHPNDGPFSVERRD